LLHKGLAFGKGACGHWRRSAQLYLAERRAAAAVDTVLNAEITLLESSLNTVTAESLARRPAKSRVNPDTVPAVLDGAKGRAAVAGNFVVVVTLLNREDDAIAADWRAVGKQS